MPLPAGIATVTVTGSAFGGSGDATGSIEFRSQRVLYAALKQIGLPTSYWGTLVDGQLSIVLPAADDEGGNPSGWSYRVVERVNGGASYDISVLAANGATQDLSALAPVTSSTGTPVVVGPAGQSAYEVAVDAGFVGTQEEWLASLDGADGPAMSDASLATAVTAGTTKAVLGSTYLQGVTTFDDLTVPYFIGHRGLMSVYPEETMEGFRATVAAGIHVLELDVALLTDGALGVIHDATVDRTTTSTGNVSALSSAGFGLLTCDAGTWFQSRWPATMKAPMADDVLREFGNKVCLVIEGKSLAAVAALTVLCDRNRIHKGSVVIEASNASWLAPAITGGYRTLYVAQDGATPAATFAALGINIICINAQTVADAYVAEILAAGMEAWTFNATRQWEAAKYAALGVTGLIADDALYMSGQGYRRTTDPFADQTWYHGYVNNQGGNGIGGFTAPNEWGFTTAAPGNWRGALMGWGCPIQNNPNADTYTITATIKFTSATAMDRFGSIFFGANTDLKYTSAALPGSNGWHAIVRQNGQLGLYKVTDGVAVLVAQYIAAPVAIADGGTATVKITLTATTVKLERTDQAYAAPTITDPAFRGGYFHMGLQGVVGTWKAVTIA